MKKVISLFLAILMIVSCIPASTYASDSTDVTITPTETTCPTCGTAGCTSEHLNWCSDCQKDDCGQNHCATCGTVDCTADHTNWCELCKLDNCGKDHDATEPTEATTDPVAPINEGDEEETHPMMGKYVKLTESTMFGYVTNPNWSYVIVGSYPAFMEISEVLEKDGVTYYRLKAAPGNTWPTAGGYSDDTVYLESTKLTEVTWCADCQKYDCGENHSQPPVEPENPCQCCESCTGAEGCTCQCGNCDFCEKAEDPDVPSISATVNGQTVTVSGAALPEGATLTVMEVVSNSDGGFSYDIKVWDANGNEWQPGSGESVKVMIPVSGVEDGCTIDIVHILENEQLILDAVSKGNVLDGDGVETILSAAARAYENAIGEGGAVAYEAILGLVVENSCVSFDAVSFSIYTWNGSYTSSRAGADQKIVMRKNAATDGADGDTYYVTNKHSIYMDRGGYTPTGQSWTTSNSSIGSFSGDNTDKYFNLNGTASLGTTFTITYSVKTDWSGAKSSTITIVIVEERTVTFNANGGSCSTKSAMAITDGGSHKQNITLPNATRTGYIFNGWYTAASGGTRVGGNGTSYMPGSNGVTLYAQWTPITYTVKFDPNTANAGGGTVTGTMPTLNMTYDVETTLPRNQFVNQGDGMVFLGWATSPTGDVEHKDGAKIKNLTATNGATVTLYAKWKYGLSSTVYIGINNTYHNPKGTYTAGGVTINSYHTYPNEPAQMTGDFDRVTDTSGGWTYNSESAVPLKNQAASYINGNIFNSPDYEMTYVQGENTLGIADPTGRTVKAMLKFTDADYNAMIAAWLNGMRTTLVGYGDTSVDWQNAKAEDFLMVPYVIKFQNYDSWYIDMVVKPKALYTLAYDGNIENGYTASFTGVAFPPSAQHTEGTNVSVVSTPIGYQNNNLKVTKVIDGHTYTAEFQYWYDAKGNTYGGSTGRNTITLTEDTILYAKWNYPDASFGNLNITKNVVDKDAYEDPSATQAFTFKFTTSAAGSYSYTIYDRAANVKTTGTIANNGTFTLQDGWRIRITDLPKGATYTVTETTVNYYTASGTVSGTISAGATTYATVTNTYQKNAAYTVKHFLQNADKNGYTEQTEDRQLLNGVINTNTVAVAKTTYGGYTPMPFNQKAISADGATVVEIYYDLLPTYTVTGTINNGSVNPAKQTINHGASSAAMTFTPATGYKITGVTVNGVAQTGFSATGYTYPAQNNVTRDINVVVTTSPITYTVTGTINNGSVNPAKQTINHGASSAAMVFTPATGYKITGVTVNGVAQTGFSATGYTYPAQNNVTRDINVVVTTSPITYTVRGTIDNEGTVNNGDQTVNHGASSAAMVFTPATGYKITGVTVNNVAQTGFSATGYTYPAQNNVTRDINVVVTTSPITYKVRGTIDNEGTVNNGNQTVNHGASSAAMVFTPAMGCKITGITVTVNGTTTTVPVANENSYTYPAQTVTGDIQVVVTTAKNAYTVTYKVDDAVYKTEQYQYGAQVAVQSAPTKPGYTFSGWTVSGATVTDGKFNMPADNVTITGEFNPNEYTINYDFNGGSNPGNNATYTPDRRIMLKDSIKTGYQFGGWKVTVADGNWVLNDVYGPAGDSNPNGITIPAGQYGNITLTAQWQTQYSYKLNFDANKPIDATASVVGMPTAQTQGWCDDASKTFTWTEAPTLANYKFLGWSTDSSAATGSTEKSYTITGTGAQEASVTLYAIWTLDSANYTVEIYREKVDSDTYDKETVQLPGTIGTEVSVNASDYLVDGFVFDAEKSVLTGTVAANDALVLKVYYNRNRYTVTGTLNGETKYTETVKHGASSSEIAFAPENQFAINSIKVNNENVAVTEDNKYGFTYPAQSDVTQDITVVVTTERVKANLTVSVAGNIGDQSFVLIVKDKNGNEVVRVALYPEKTSQTIVDLPMGEYTVTPAEGWAWRQNLGAKTVNVDGVNDSVEFTWSSVNTISRWLNGYSSKKLQPNARKRKI